MPAVVFRCDGGPDIGLGHVMRCRALATAFAGQGWTTHFAMSDTAAKAFPDIKPIIVPGGIDGAGKTRLAMIEQGATCLVIDHYGLDAEFEREAGTKSALLLVIDDLANRPHHCDLLIDTNPARNAADYAPFATTQTKLLLGAKYALLRPEFATTRREPGKTHPPRQLIAALGGSDPGNVSAAILEAVPQLASAGLHVTLIVGRTNPRQADLLALGRSLGADVVCDPANAVALMADTDIAISGAGTTCLEFACLGVPTLALILAGNQRAVAKAMADAGAAQILDAENGLQPVKITEAVLALAASNDMRERMSAAGRALVDGKGAARVVAEAVRLHAARKFRQ